MPESPAQTFLAAGAGRERTGGEDGRHRLGQLIQFVAGPENRLAEAALWGLLAGEEDYNPIVLHGHSGVGKSQLARDAYNAWKALHPDRPAALVAGIEFARQLTDAIETQSVEDFRDHYRGLAMLVVDDLHLLSGKTAAQEELMHTVDAVARSSGAVLITCRWPPDQLGGFLSGLVSRLSAGLTVPLVPPGPEARRALLGRYVAALGFPWSEAALELVDQRFRGTAAQLEGLVKQVALTAGQPAARIGPELVASVLDHRPGAGQPELRVIAMAAAKGFSVRLGDLRSGSRRRAVVLARAMAMYLARNLSERTFEEIGRYFGGRDRTTVSHACQRMEALLAQDPSLRQLYTQLEQQLRA